VTYIDDEHWRWKHAVIDAYKPIGETEMEWLACPVCKVHPRIWEFDNGRYAKCVCGDLYEGAQASAESIMDVHIRDGGNVSAYDVDDLRKAWNERVNTMDISAPAKGE
jgi:hypothetical protein